MAGRIPPDFIDEVLARTDLVELIGAAVPLKKSGAEYKACCPFHNEKTPSFYVSPQKQFFHCFGCGANGNAVGFLMDYHHMEFVDAIEDLAGRAGLTVPRDDDGRPHQDHSDLRRLVEQADVWFRQQLRSHADGPKAANYLRERGVSGEIAAAYGLGFAPPGWENLVREFPQERQAAAAEAGLIGLRENGTAYDRFRDRVMFPIRDRRGRVIAFGGRVMGDDTPKYLNSPETPLFHKGRELYGLYEVKQAMRQIDRLLVVEGYMDVIALAQAGIRYAVATLGTATTPEHLHGLFRVCDEVVFCFDGDRAGRDAAWKALNTALPLMDGSHQVRFLLLPHGEDPDSLVRQEGPNAFEERIKAATPFSEFLINHYVDEIKQGSIEERTQAAHQARPLLQQMPAGILRTGIMDSLAEALHLRGQQIEKMVGDEPPPPPRRAQPARQQQRSRKGGLSLVAKTIAMLIQRPELAPLGDRLIAHHDPDVPGVPLLVSLLELLQTHPNLTTAALLERWRDQPEAQHLNRLASWKSELGNSSWDADFPGAVTNLEKDFRESLYGRMMASASLSSMDPSEREYMNLHHAARANQIAEPDRDRYDALFEHLRTRYPSGNGP